ncbi:hypothetical protein Chor_005834 [Crotalus horridus]
MWQTLALGLLFFPALFAAFIRSLSWLAPAWSLKDRLVLSSRLVSTIQAIMATLSGLVVIFSCKDVVHDRHWIAREYIWIVVSYMTYDIYVMYLCYWHKSQEKGPASGNYSWKILRSFLQKERLMVTHHLFILFVLTPVATVKMQDSLLHKINGILILVTFFLCRILLFPYMYWAYGRQMNLPIYEVPFRIPLHCNVANAFLIAPQIYWFVLICRKAMRLYSSSPAPDRMR